MPACWPWLKARVNTSPHSRSTSLLLSSNPRRWSQTALHPSLPTCQKQVACTRFSCSPVLVVHPRNTWPRLKRTLCVHTSPTDHPQTAQGSQTFCPQSFAIAPNHTSLRSGTQCSTLCTRSTSHTLLPGPRRWGCSTSQVGPQHVMQCR